MGSFKARKNRALKLPIVPAFQAGSIKLTVLEDESRVATIGRVHLARL